jgi:hypothetical protein
MAPSDIRRTSSLKDQRNTFTQALAQFADDTDTFPYETLEKSGLPTATVGVDANQSGHVDFFYTGVDLDRDGIPDALKDAPLPEVAPSRVSKSPTPQ